MSEERSRIDHERGERERREQAEVAERESRVRLRRQEEALAAARERERLTEEDRRRREEEARLDGIRTAEVARVREEAARRAELESATLRREHELKLASIRQGASVRTLRLGLIASVVATLVAGAALAWLELARNPAQLAALERDYASATASERARADRAEGLLAKSETTRRELEARLRALEAASPPATTAAPGPRVPPVRVPPRVPGRGKPGKNSPPCIDDHDPLNPCLGR